MLKIASPLLRFPAIFGAFFALFAGTILFSSTAHAANSQPTYTLTAGSLITAKGGFIDDPNASNPMFIQSGGKWVFEGAGDSRQTGYYNTTTREIYFKWSSAAQAYVTHTNYANSGGVVIAGDACDVSIKIDPGVTTGGTFVGTSVRTGKQTSACTTAVKDKIQLSSDPVFNNVSQATGETFFGVTIPTCTQTPGTSAYNTCVSQRKTALNNLANAITCDTSSQQGIAECTYNKSILSCLQASPGNTVARCKTKADAQAILNGDYSAITADTTDASIKAICQTLSGKDNQAKCITAATAERDRLKGTDGTGVNKTSCAVDGIGWIVCPLLTFMAKANDSAFSFLQSFLSIRPGLLTDTGTKNAWSAFRDIANVAFVIAFLVIVYSQLTSAGVSNYGIKKMLPRIVVAAILVNVSYYICEIAVDLSNIVGSSIYTLLKDSININPDIVNPSWQDQTSNILAKAATGIFVVLLIILVIAAPISLLAFGLIILILIARQAFVILLVVMAPLAFVAYLLPNTESWFKKWWKAFTTILMVYPIIGVVFGGSSLAANILSSAAAHEDDASLLQLTALGVMAIPLFAVPALLKGSLSAAGSAGQKLAGLQDRANRRGLRGIKESRLGEAKTAWDARRQENQVARRIHGGYIGKGRVGRALATYGENRGGKIGRVAQWVGAPGKQLDNSSIARTIGADRGAAAAVSAYHKLAHEEMERQGSTMSEMNAGQLFEILKDTKASSEKRAAAARRIAAVGGDQHVEQAFDYMMTQGAVHKAGGDSGFGDVQQLAASELLRRKPAGISTSQANAMNTGDLASAGGYYEAFKARIQEGKFGAKDYASMPTDDLVRLAEMANSKDPAIQLSDEDISHIMTEYANIEGDETLKGTLTDERKNLFAQIAARAAPTKLTGKDYNLAKLKTP